MLKSKKEKLEKELLKENLQNIDLREEDITQPDNENEDEFRDLIAEKDKENDDNEKDKQAGHYKDLYLRKAAEFENFKRRTETEISNLYRYANEGLISELLPVLDDFNRIKNSWDENHDPEAFKKGFDLVYDKFFKVLEKQGLKEMESLGKKFDVNLHEALLQQPAKEVEPDTVTKVIENGYYLKDKVLRHAKVVVSSPAEEGK